MACSFHAGKWLLIRRIVRAGGGDTDMSRSSAQHGLVGRSTTPHAEPCAARALKPEVGGIGEAYEHGVLAGSLAMRMTQIDPMRPLNGKERRRSTSKLSGRQRRSAGAKGYVAHSAIMSAT